MPNFLSMTKRFPRFVGREKYCNICGYRFAKFNLFGNSPREAQCPICGSLERHRHLYIHIASIYPFLEEKSILHFAPELMFKKIFSDSGANYYDADIAPGRATHQVDITNITFNDKEFDYIFCIHVLEHIPNDIKAMQELYRVLKPGGAGFLAVPLGNEFLEDTTVTDPEGRLRLYGQCDHVRIYTLDEFCNRLKSVGFNTDLISRPNNFPAPLLDANLGDPIVIARKL